MLPAAPDATVGVAICTALREQAARLGLSLGDEPLWAQASFEQTLDRFSQEVSLVAVWRGQARDGSVIFFPDGRIFAEYQVLLPHPQRDDAYVEAVQVWGRAEKLRGDAVIVEYAK